MSQAEPGATTQVSERNTKQEILTAYQRLREQVEGRLAALPFDAQRGALTEALQTFANLKTKLDMELEQLADSLRADLTRLEELQTRANQEKQRVGRQFDDQVKRIETDADRLNEEWERAKTAAATEDAEATMRRDRERKREEEEYQYQRDLERRKEADAYAETKARREAEFANRETALTTREAAVAAQETEVANLPKQIEAAVAATRQEVTADLTRTHQQAIKDLEQRHAHAAAVAQLKIESLELTLKSQAAEIETLRREKAEVTRQLKDMALAAMETRSKTLPPSQEPHA